MTFPTPLVVNWDPVAYAIEYDLTIATDPALTTVVTKLTGSSATSGTQFAPDQPKPGTYWWQVTPLDASGHTGTPSEIRSFTWEWPSAMSNLLVSDTSPSDTVFDPQFSWDLVDGAKGYELEVNPAADFASGSKVCCTGTIYGTTYSPVNVLENNTFYWRVRPIDVSGASGDWTQGTPFTQQYDNTPPSIQNLRLIAPDGATWPAPRPTRRSSRGIRSTAPRTTTSTSPSSTAASATGAQPTSGTRRRCRTTGRRSAGMEQRQAVPDARQRLDGHSRHGTGRSLLRPRPGRARPHLERRLGVRHLHLPGRRFHRVLHLQRLPRRRIVHAVVQRGLPG